MLTAQGYQLISPQIEITKEYIKNSAGSIYHYHGSVPIDNVLVDNNQKIIGKQNLYIGDISVLNRPWGGSTSFPALVTGYQAAKSIISSYNPSLPQTATKKILCLHGGGGNSTVFRNQLGMLTLINDNSNNYQFVFADSPISGGVWWADPPGGKGEPTTDPEHANISISYLNLTN